MVPATLTRSLATSMTTSFTKTRSSVNSILQNSSKIPTGNCGRTEETNKLTFDLGDAAFDVVDAALTVDLHTCATERGGNGGSHERERVLRENGTRQGSSICGSCQRWGQEWIPPMCFSCFSLETVLDWYSNILYPILGFGVFIGLIQWCFVPYFRIWGFHWR